MQTPKKTTNACRGGMLEDHDGVKSFVYPAPVLILGDIQEHQSILLVNGGQNEQFLDCNYLIPGNELEQVSPEMKWPNCTEMAMCKVFEAAAADPSISSRLLKRHSLSNIYIYGP